MKNLCFPIIALLFFHLTYSQEGVSFKENKQLYVRGNSILIGNNILGDHPTEPLMDISIPNDVVKMKYIDIDADETTFSSSEATIKNVLGKPKIAHAALYWCGLYPSEKGALRKSGNKMIHVGRGDRDGAINSILFKTPNGSYEALSGKVIFDSYDTEVFTTNSPYVCYADVTTKLQSLAILNGTYTVANIKATEGEISGGGSAGWLLYVVYEDPSESPKYFTTYNGLVEVNKEAVEINFKGFKSKEEGIVTTTIALGAMEGDRKIKTDEFSIFDKKAGRYKPLSNKLREEKNFFNSSITMGDEFFTDRNPNSANTLGFDLLKMEIPNPNNDFFDNATTQANLQFQAKADRFYLFFVAFETEINKDFLEEKIKPVADTIISTTPIVEIQDSIEEEPSNVIVAAKEKETKPIQKNTPAIKKPKENVVPKKPIVLSEEDKIKREVRVQSMSVPGLASGYYLVTNVFSVSANATKWSQFLTEKSYSPQTFINSRNNWNYVYVANNNALMPVYEKWKQYKGFEYFKEIWIMKINL
ncbi:hypothetical protein [Aequorivita antarctica]|uniref:SPOR domain-containing protein n=1 Tax=Aequorivita antarctica TaxID=153266 RepID=A0A5C6Z389_9FLAO|nr:hypothetical protein [Aequorivita antarctica]TXD74659.1 hypothetical protein ESU54_00240 [Aequorivita antarctica]SRX72719.1 hypothetical protein AEQU3_00472 [Aequorivita antarctica]